ncbi:MAG: ATP-binding cassette domain-containing protein [Candidatus Eisenbacteria bacterium]|nr:ATP-binding cassette domain-containing protein [Candidatus Eisenbacteria bacterium]
MRRDPDRALRGRRAGGPLGPAQPGDHDGRRELARGRLQRAGGDSKPGGPRRRRRERSGGPGDVTKRSSELTITLEGVDVEFGSGFPGAHLALRGVDLTLEVAGCLAVIGPTGAGKTTLLEVAAGLLAPTRGDVRLSMGDSVSDSPLRSSAGLVYQFPELQFFEDTVYEDVAFGPRRMGLDESEVSARVADALERSGLSPDAFEGRDLTTLSAGEKRRAAIAGILALERPFLLLDEPTAGLDPATRECVVDLLLSESEARGVALVSHDLELVDRVATRTVVMNEGSIAVDDETSRVLSDVAGLEALGLAPPVEYALLSLVRERAPAEARRVRRALFDARVADANT